MFASKNFLIAASSGFSASGGNEVKTVGAYRYHIFTGSGTFSVASLGAAGTTFSVTSIGGGGGGGKNDAGGGGGGAIDIWTSVTAAVASYTVTVGAKGTGGTGANGNGANGGNSSFALGATVYTNSLGGGGGGGCFSNGVGGGSGGGGGGCTGPYSGGSASGSNTNAGGLGKRVAQYAAGGGGGATAVGGDSDGTHPGNGGQGYTLTTIDSNLTSGNFTSFTGMTVVSSGGGGGGHNEGSTAYGVGGTGAGSGGLWSFGLVRSSSAATSFGSGGGGGLWADQGDLPGSDGYAGVVIIRYAV